MRLYGLQTGVADRNARRLLVASASTLRGSPRRHFCRSASSRVSRCEIRCFSCSINVVILLVSPWSVDRPPFAVLRYSPRNANEPTKKRPEPQKLLSGRILDDTSDLPTRSV